MRGATPKVSVGGKGVASLCGHARRAGWRLLIYPRPRTLSLALARAGIMADRELVRAAGEEGPQGTPQARGLRLLQARPNTLPLLAEWAVRVHSGASAGAVAPASRVAALRCAHAHALAALAVALLSARLLSGDEARQALASLRGDAERFAEAKAAMHAAMTNGAYLARLFERGDARHERGLAAAAEAALELLARAAAAHDARASRVEQLFTPQAGASYEDAGQHVVAAEALDDIILIPQVRLAPFAGLRPRSPARQVESCMTVVRGARLC